VRRLGLALLLTVAAGASPARASPLIDLYTMGPGDELFSAFGHAAICVRDGEAPAGRCYNYGTADFTTPVPLTWAFIRGRALFWVSVADTPWMLSYYVATGRAVWRQTLPLAPDEAERVAAALAASADERVKYYRYHHFDDNCTTRIRDVLDRATGGRLGRDRVVGPRSFRDWAREGFAGDWPLLTAVELLLGRSADRRTDSWTAMFLPSQLRLEVARHFAAEPVLILPGRPRPLPGSTRLGLAVWILAGVALALLVTLAFRRGGRHARAIALTLTALLLGLVGTILWALAALSTFPELTRNEMLLALWPTDLVLPFLGPTWLRRYAGLRLIVLAALVVGHAVHWLVQPLAPAVLALGPMLALFAGTASSRSRP
jgi:hypothetical protein